MSPTIKIEEPKAEAFPGERAERHVLWGAIALLLLLVAAIVTVVIVVGPEEAPVAKTRMQTSAFGYTLELPERWVATRFEGHDEYRPPGMPSLAQGGDTFAIDAAPSAAFIGIPCTLEQDILPMRNGIVADACFVTESDGSQHGWYLAAPPTAVSDITIHVIGSTQALWEANTDAATEILSSFGTIGEPVVEHGTFADGIRMDRFGTALAGFLEARVLGNGADYWMGPDAESLYLESQTLYADVDGNHWLSYEVTEVRGVDANSVEFDVTLRSDAGEVTETMGVGPGVNVGGVGMPAVIRFGGAS